MHLIAVKTDLTQAAHSHVSSGLFIIIFLIKKCRLGMSCHFKFMALMATVYWRHTATCLSSVSDVVTQGVEAPCTKECQAT